MLAPNASVLPLERQTEAVVSGLSSLTAMGDAWVEGVGAFLVSRRVYPWADVPALLLEEFARERPENDLVRPLDDAYARVGAAPLRGCPHRQEPPRTLCRPR